MNPMQLLYYQSPLSSAMLIPVLLLFEAPTNTLIKIVPFSAVAMVFLSCTIAFLVNVSIYWIIGKTSPLTYNMFGHLKFCLTVIGGYLIFNEPMSFMQILGVILTFSGVTLYAHFKVCKIKLVFMHKFKKYYITLKNFFFQFKESAENTKSLEEG